MTGCVVRPWRSSKRSTQWCSSIVAWRGLRRGREYRPLSKSSRRFKFGAMLLFNGHVPSQSRARRSPCTGRGTLICWGHGSPTLLTELWRMQAGSPGRTLLWTSSPRMDSDRLFAGALGGSTPTVARRRTCILGAWLQPHARWQSKSGLWLGRQDSGCRRRRPDAPVRPFIYGSVVFGCVFQRKGIKLLRLGSSMLSC